MRAKCDTGSDTMSGLDDVSGRLGAAQLQLTRHSMVLSTLRPATGRGAVVVRTRILTIVGRKGQNGQNQGEYAVRLRRTLARKRVKKHDGWAHHVEHPSFRMMLGCMVVNL